jgi:hypothetical protein
METLTAEEYRAQYPAHATRDRKQRDKNGRPDRSAELIREAQANVLQRLRDQTSPITTKDPKPAPEPEIHELDRLMREYQD